MLQCTCISIILIKTMSYWTMKKQDLQTGVFFCLGWKISREFGLLLMHVNQQSVGTNNTSTMFQSYLRDEDFIASKLYLCQSCVTVVLKWHSFFWQTQIMQVWLFYPMAPIYMFTLHRWFSTSHGQTLPWSSACRANLCTFRWFAKLGLIQLYSSNSVTLLWLK